MLNFYISYTKEVLMQYKGRLGGGCLILIAAGLIEHFTSNAIPWSTYVWFLAASFIIALFVHGANQHKRLQPKLVVRSVERSVWPFDRYGKTGAGYHFTIENLSEAESLEDVQAQIIDIQPEVDYLPLPAPMKIKHRNWDVKKISLNPQWREQIDLITGPTSDPRSQKVIIIVYNIDPKETFATLPLGKYRITVKVGAKNIRPVIAKFEAWVDDAGELRCVLI